MEEDNDNDKPHFCILPTKPHGQPIWTIIDNTGQGDEPLRLDGTQYATEEELRIYLFFKVLLK